jgi:DNA-binding NtrC family response regulator
MARILLAEDDIDLRPLLEHVLLDAGHDVSAVETVASARRLLDENSYDMVVADGTLIDGTGIDIAEKAAEQGVAALIITGNALRLPQERLQRFDHLLKPLGAAELIKAIERSLRKMTGKWT